MSKTINLHYQFIEKALFMINISLLPHEVTIKIKNKLQ